MPLGGFKRFDEVFVNGVCVGHTESSSPFPIGKHCQALTFDGKTVARMGLELDRFEAVDLSITKIQDGEFMLSTHGNGSLDEWDKLFSDAIIHIRNLKVGKV
tara:strand:- start:2122 stop:2427 length:306 start_codon:yes stop_codon:yes gene_type:complete